MLTIHKFPLHITDEQTVQMPGRHKLLSVAMQNTTLCMWAYVETDSAPTTVKITVVGTGNPFPHNVAPNDFIGSVQDGPFVWHVFEAR